MDDRHVFGSFGRGRGLLSSGYSSDRVGSRSILKTPQEFEASAPRRLSFFGSSHGRGRSVHMEMGDLDGPFGRSFNMDRHGEDHEDPSHCDRFDLDPVRNTREESLSTPPKSDPDEGLNSLVRVMKSLNENFEKQGYKGSHLPFKIDKFDGKTGSQLKPFLAKFEIMAKRGQWNEDMKADMLKCNLTGAAAQLLWDDPNCQSYEQLVMKLNQRFGEENQAECFRAKLKVRKQGRDESLSSLMQDIRRMMILAYPDSSSELGRIMSKDCFLDAIFDKNLSLKVREHSPVDLDAAFQLAVKFEAYAQLSGPSKGEDRYRVSEVRTVASSNQNIDCGQESAWNSMVAFQNNLMKQLESQGNLISMLSEQVQGLMANSSQSKEQVNNSSSKRQIKCFGCGEAGHVAPKCPYKKESKKSVGNNVVSGSGSEPDVAVVSSISGALIIRARINGRIYPCLIDTGSEVSLINKSLICDDDLKMSNRTLRAANGSSIEVSGVIELPLFIGRHQFTSSFIVSPQIQNIILGLDWLKEHNCLIDCSNSTLIAGDQRFKLSHVNIERKGSVNCRILEVSREIPDPSVRSQARATHMHKLNVVHKPEEPIDLLESMDPGGTRSPATQVGIGRVKPRRATKKSLRITNAGIFNLLEDHEAAIGSSTFRCHLCEHSPFCVRRLWKGHLFVVHGVTLSSVVKKAAEQSAPVVGNSSEACPPIVKSEDTPLCENVPNDVGENVEVENMDAAVMVASIWCSASNVEKNVNGLMLSNSASPEIGNVVSVSSLSPGDDTIESRDSEDVRLCRTDAL